MRGATCFLINQNVRSESKQPQESLALARKGVIETVKTIFSVQKISASDCSQIILFFRAISASMFLLSLFLLKKRV